MEKKGENKMGERPGIGRLEGIKVKKKAKVKLIEIYCDFTIEVVII